MNALRTESFELSYQKAADLIPLLTSANQRILSKRGSAVVDARTNTLFVRIRAAGLEEARKLISQIDVPVRQVMIEARFVEAGTTFARTLGGKLTSTTANSGGANSQSITSNTNTSLGSGGSGISLIFGSGTSRTLSLELEAAETDGTTKSIASPRVVTADSTPADIEQGVQVPYVTTAVAGATPTTQFVSANLSLKVTPHITPDDKINMQLEVHKDSVGTAPAGTEPPINTNVVTTTVLVDNGGTVVVGGVYTQGETNTTTRRRFWATFPCWAGCSRTTPRT